MLPYEKMFQVHQWPSEEPRILLAEERIRNQNLEAGVHLSTDGEQEWHSCSWTLHSSGRTRKICYFSKVLCFILIFSNVLCSFVKLFPPHRQKIGSSTPFYTITAQFIMKVPRRWTHRTCLFEWLYPQSSRTWPGSGQDLLSAEPWQKEQLWAN